MFSIIIPSLNEGYYLDITLDSIYNYSNNDLLKEIIIIDDGSDNDDYKFLDKHPLRKKITLLKNEGRKGLAYTKNKGAKYASGEILIFLDAHMYCNNLDLNKLKLLKSYIDKGAMQGNVGDLANKKTKGQIYKIKSYVLDTTWLEPYEEDYDNNNVVETTAIAGGFTIISKKIFDKVGGFNKKFNSWGSEDIELSFRLWTYGYNLFYTNQIGVAHYFKQKFNYEVKAEDVLYNKCITYKLYFENFFRKSCLVINALDKQYGSKLVKKTFLKIENDKSLINFINKYRSKQIRNIEDYFNKFNKYYEKL